VRYRFGRFVLSPARRLLWRDGQEIALIPRYFDLLHLLIAQRNRAVNRQEIFDVVWADVVVSDGALTQAIRTIRRGLGDDPREPQFIRTVSRHGYQFIWPDVREEPDEGPVTSPAPIATTPAAAAADDPFARWLMVLLREGDAADATEEERYDAAIRLHELGTDEALKRLDERPGHAEARAILRDARWNAPGAGAVPLLSAESRTEAIADVLALRLRHAAALASARWASASLATAGAGIVAGLVGGCALALVPESTTGLDLAVTFAIIGALAGAAGGAGIGAGLAAAEAVARSARAAALTALGALAGMLSGALAQQVVRSVVTAVFGHTVSALPGAIEGLVVGSAVGAGYALATRRLPEGGMAAPRGSARWRVALLTGLVAAAAGVALALGGRHLVGSSLDVIAEAFAGSEVGLDALARLLGEDSIRPFTRAIVNGLEALLFGAGLAFGLTRRPKANHGDTENTGNAQRIG
jgi:DNA-binding winged helix-turn-helix (wHTH) protein